MNDNLTLRDLILDPAKAENILHALRHANEGYALTVWKDGGWCLWKPLDAKYAAMAAEGTSDEVLVTIPIAELATVTPQSPG